MRALKHQLLIVLLLFLSFSSCKKEATVTPAIDTAFLDDIISVDVEEKVMLYNGEGIDVAEESLFLDNAEILFNADVISQLAVGRAYESRWKENDYRFYRTELPILKIQTRSNSEIGERYESSQFVLMESGEIVLKGNLGIRLRGNTSLAFPKKSYRLELWEDAEGETSRDASVLNMRKDDDWLLDGMWNEPLSIRDKSAMELWLSFGQVQDVDEEDIVLGAAREYCELFINGSYKGLYYIGERLDRKQLKLEKFSDQSDGGELYKAKGWGEAVIAFSLPDYDNNSLEWGGYEVKYPQEVGAYDWQKLKDFIAYFKGQIPNDFDELYPQKLDVDNIIDYFILVNVLGAFDNVGNNVYIARKDQSSPYYFVSWDYDATLGLGITGDLFSLENDFIQHVVTRQLWFSSAFKDKLKMRWENLRSDQLADEKIKSHYRNNHSVLLRNGVYEREETIGRLEKPSPGLASMGYLEETLVQRLQFLDEAIGNL
ncbi:MAG: CotH kinase family protein [Bacteroidota bacterium]